MKAFYYELRNPYDLQIKEYIIDKPSPYEILAQTIFTALSPGTETAAYSGAPPLRPMKVYPRILGYCNVARVIAVGGDVPGISAGDSILTFQSHRSHFVCRKEDIILKINDVSDLKAATSAYLYHLGYSALLAANIQPGLNVAIIGFGTLGKSAASLSSLFCCKTFVYSGQQNLCEQESKNDSKFFFSKSANPQRIAQLTHGTGIDVVINTSNSWNDWSLALELVRRKGTVVNLGFPGRGTDLPSFNPLDSKYLYDKEITVKYNEVVSERDVAPHEARFSMKRNIRFLLDLIESGKIDPYEIISADVRWDRLEEMYKRILSRQEPFFSAILNWT